MKLYNVENLDESYYHYRTEMGLDVFYIAKEKYDRQYAVFSTNFGSVDNKFIPIGETDYLTMPDGVAHFLEHKLFEEPDKNIFDEFSELGANANAFTGFDQTSYLFSTTENFYEALKVLIEFVQNPYFTDENVEKEKGIIEQEIRMYDDDPGWRVFFNCISNMYYEHPVRVDIAGTVESIQAIDKEVLYKAYNTFYHPENMVLYIVGDLDPSRIKELVDRVERKDYQTLGEIKRGLVDEKSEIKTAYVEEKMETSNPLFYIGYKEDVERLSPEEEVKRDLISNIVVDMLFSSSSPFYNKLYEESLVNGFGSYYTGRYDYGHTFIVGEADDPNVVYEEIKKFLESPREEILREEDFIRIRNDEIGNFIMGFDSIEFIAHTGIEMYFSDYSMFKYIDLLEGLEFQEVLDRFEEMFREDRSVLSVVSPK